ncbi:hypothetical protein [uncultured Bacteroides sp.]|nr:hypothetical protein [uncultured Bacteroides sp.]MDE5702750.1 hypothetical protein [Bacteroides sp.]
MSVCTDWRARPSVQAKSGLHHPGQAIIAIRAHQWQAVIVIRAHLCPL